MANDVMLRCEAVENLGPHVAVCPDGTHKLTDKFDSARSLTDLNSEVLCDETAGAKEQVPA